MIYKLWNFNVLLGVNKTCMRESQSVGITILLYRVQSCAMFNLALTCALNGGLDL